MDIIFGNCIEELKKLSDKSVQATITSPPYDNLRTYNNTLAWNFEIFKPIARELYRVTKDGGVVVWVVGDATIKGSETGTSFRQALYFMECGFNLHDTMIYKKNSSTYPSHKKSTRYTQIFEYMFVFSKGKPISNLICDKKNKWVGYKDFSGKLKNPVPEFSPRINIWEYVTSFGKTNHPAVFPLQLAIDHILSWSNENDTILDPFMGSGTTGIACIETNRNFIGIEVVEEYFYEARKRITQYEHQQQL